MENPPTTDQAFENPRARGNLFGEILHATPQGILVARVSSRRFVVANPAICRMLGYGTEEILNLAITDIHPPEDLNWICAAFEAGAQGEAALPTDIPVRRKDGSILHCSIVNTPLIINGEHYLAGFFQDISAQIEAKKELQHSRLFLETVLDNISDSICVINTDDFSIARANRAFMKNYSINEEDVLGKTCYEVTHHRKDPCRGPEDPCPLIETLKTGKPCTRTHEHRDSQGRRIIAEITTSPLFDEKSGEISQIVHSARDITDRVQIEETLAHKATHDDLTGLFNRSMVAETLGMSLERAKRYRENIAVLLIDLDDFKLVNDTLGHEAGDELLRQVADRLQETVRSCDLIARQGGDEFILLLSGRSEPGEELENASRSDNFHGEVALIANRIIREFERPYLLKGMDTYVNASIGISLFPWDAKEVTTLLQQANSAMYQAKELGKGHCRFFSSDLSPGQKHRLELVTKLHKALENREFVLHYQPIIDLATGGIAGAEALIRWAPPGEALIPPMDFLTVAEETGLIIPIGDWVLREACRQIGAWRNSGRDVKIAVNLSVRQFWHGDIADMVKTAVADAGIPMQLLELEITESAMVLHASHTEDILRSFRAEGLSISLDDFGTGYSSLSRLKNLPIDKLKIDKSFVDGIPASEQDCVIIHAIIALARSLDIETLAEGVETEKQRRFLRNLGCRYAQGYHFSRPLCTEEFQDLFDRCRSCPPD